MKTVTFCGHRDVDTAEIIEEKLYTEIEKLIQQGASEFLLGGYGRFDSLCAKTVRSLKEKYPHITLVLVLAYMNKDFDKDLYDSSEYPSLEMVPKRFAILKRNEYMIKKADAVIAYVKRSWGGAAKTLEFAQKKRKYIIRIDEMI